MKGVELHFPRLLTFWSKPLPVPSTAVYRPWLVRMPQQAFFLSGARSGNGPGSAPLLRDICGASEVTPAGSPGQTSRAYRSDRNSGAPARVRAGGGLRRRWERVEQSDWLNGSVVVLFNPHDCVTSAATCGRQWTNPNVHPEPCVLNPQPCAALKLQLCLGLRCSSPPHISCFRLAAELSYICRTNPRTNKVQITSASIIS